jgi:hypothetical protein
MVVLAPASASAAEGPVWKILTVSNPTDFKPGAALLAQNAIVVMAINVGGGSTGCTAALIESEKLREENEEKEEIEKERIQAEKLSEPARQAKLEELEKEIKQLEEGKLGLPRAKKGACPPGSPVVSPVTITDSLPAGLTVTEKISGLDSYKDPAFEYNVQYIEERTPAGSLTCSSSPVISCTDPDRVDPGDTLIVSIPVSVGSGLPSSVTNEATVSGGGAVSASASTQVTIGSESSGYGVAPGGLLLGASTGQADAHPNVTNAFFLNTTNLKGEGWYSEMGPAGAPKDVGLDLPPGLVGTTVGMPRCTMAEVSNSAHCPRDSMVGTATVIVTGGAPYRQVLTFPVYNIAPAPGEPAAFAFNGIFAPVRLDTSVLSDGDYGVRVTAPDLTEVAATLAASITLWGVPADHNGPGPDFSTSTFQSDEDNSEEWVSFGRPGSEQTRVPFLTNPSQCSSPLGATLLTDSWEAPGPGVFAEGLTSMGMDTGCGLLSFDPSLSMLPDTLEAGAPAGYSLNLNVPQNSEPEGLATPDVKKVVATLPSGTVISPSAADGLGDCTDAQFELHSGVPGGCPRDSQVGVVRIKTPALEEQLNGEVYLAAPECDPCTPQDAADGKMIRLFVQVVGEGEDGVIVKLEGTGQINQQTGQITTTFNENPQLPFSDFQLMLTGGERATLANPRTCGSETTTMDLTPWSTPYTPDATPTSTFDIDANCFGAQFNPSFTAGTTSNQAGGFSPFTLAFGRSDSDEFLNGVQIQMPPGLLGMLSKVALCGEPQAAQGTCGPESLIGETTVETGPGTDPFLVTGGKVYITGPYKGAPYGLSIIVPAVAGPYTLAGTTGNGTVVNRSAISVNHETSALTVTSDPLPTELDGIPLQLRLVNVTINRPEFTFNPTSCDRLAIGGTLTSTQAASASESSSFQVTNCGGLAFKPKFTASTSGKTSKADGASLDTKVTYPSAPQGSEADIKEVKVDLPKQLPSRLTTLQKACLAATFGANPANCPAASVIGIVKVSTPVLPVQLTGPVYFVSHGGEAFPSLTMVLQGDGVRVDLVGDTFISKAGITSTTFKTVPDVPFNSFELYLPEGRYSALAANGDLCTQNLEMPTAFVAQNGKEIHESTKIAVTGCQKAKKATAKHKKQKNKRDKKAGKASHHTHGRSS